MTTQDTGKKTRKPTNNQEMTDKKRREGKNLGGRPKFEINYEVLQGLCEIFCTAVECAAVLRTSKETLNLRLQEDYAEALTNYEADPSEENAEILNQRGNGFSAYFEYFSGEGKASLRREQFKAARAGSASMLKHLGENYLGQRRRIDHTTKGEKLPGNAPATHEELDLSQLSEDEFAQLGETLQKAKKKTTISKTAKTPVH